MSEKNKKQDDAINKNILEVEAYENFQFTDYWGMLTGLLSGINSSIDEREYFAKLIIENPKLKNELSTNVTDIDEFDVELFCKAMASTHNYLKEVNNIDTLVKETNTLMEFSFTNILFVYEKMKDTETEIKIILNKYKDIKLDDTLKYSLTLAQKIISSFIEYLYLYGEVKPKIKLVLFNELTLEYDIENPKFNKLVKTIIEKSKSITHSTSDDFIEY